MQLAEEINRQHSGYAGQSTYVLARRDKVEFYDHQGTHIIEHPWPPWHHLRRQATPSTPTTVTDVLRHHKILLELLRELSTTLR